MTDLKVCRCEASVQKKRTILSFRLLVDPDIVSTSTPVFPFSLPPHFFFFFLTSMMTGIIKLIPACFSVADLQPKEAVGIREGEDVWCINEPLQITDLRVGILFRST